jgi:hypothetical protein
LASLGRTLDPVEQNEFESIDDYLNQKDEKPIVTITSMDLKAALGVKTNVFRDLTQK